MVNTGKNNNSAPRTPLPQLRLCLRNRPEGEGAEFLPPRSREVARPPKGMTSRCQELGPAATAPTTCTSQMSVQSKEGCSNLQAPEEHRLRAQAGSVLAGRWPLLPRET